MTLQACSAFPMHSGKRYRTNGPLVLHEMLSKYIYIGSVYHMGATLLTVFHRCFETLQMFSVWHQDVHVVLV